MADQRSDLDDLIAHKQADVWSARGPASGVTLADVHRMDLVQLATFAVAHPGLAGVVSLELQRRPRRADPAAGRVLVRAYREGHADGHLTASLLSSMPTEDGYEVAAEILGVARGAHDAWVAGPAADAMVVHDASAACAVFLELICDDAMNHGLRRCIALTLNQMNDARIVPAISEAVRAGRLGPVLGAAAIQLYPIETGRLVEWLGTEDGEVATLAFDVIRRHRYWDVDEAIAHAIRAACDAGRLRLSKAEREHFERALVRVAEERTWLGSFRKHP
jgi:hypothetical protein